MLNATRTRSGYVRVKAKKNCEFCEGTGEVVVDAGYCGGCEICGSREERVEPCSCTFEERDEDDSDQDRDQ